MQLQFNKKANSYSQAAIVQQHLATWLAQWLEPVEQTLALTALELGSADGLFTRLLASRFGHLTAIDIAPRMVERGRRMLPNVQWQVGDGWHLAGPSVDRLFSASFLQWCDDPVSVLRHWRTFAKSGARMLHGFYVAPTLSEWQTLAKTRSPVTWRSPGEWIRHFREAGWFVLRSESRNHMQRFQSALELVRFFHKTGAITPNHISVGTLRQIISGYDKKYASTDGSPGVTSTWTFFRIEVENGVL